MDAATAVGAHLFDRPAVARLLMHWLMSTSQPNANFVVSVRADDARRPAGRVVPLVTEWFAGRAIGRLAPTRDPSLSIPLMGAVLLAAGDVRASAPESGAEAFARAGTRGVGARALRSGARGLRAVTREDLGAPIADRERAE